MTDTDIKNICDKIISGEIEFWISEPLDSSSRYQIHKQIDLIPEIITTTIIVGGINGKKKIKISPVRKLKPESNLESNLESKLESKLEFNLTVSIEMIEFFNKYSKLPIPINSPETIQYYLDTLSDFYNTKQYDNFISDVKVLGFNKIKNDISKVKNLIIQYINENGEYKKFLTLPKIPSYPENYIGKSSIYNSKNANKNFLSIDIKSANWNCLKRNTNSTYSGSWFDFVSNFTSSKFIQESKYFREVVFGDLGSKKIDKFMGEMIYELEQLIGSDLSISQQIKKISCTRDEIIYEIIDLNNFDFDKLTNLVKTIDLDFSIYRIETFNLVQLKPFDYFVKNIIESNDPKSNKVQFKQVPKHFVLQSIKFYTNKSINPLDKKFMFENMICSFDSDLLFDSKH